MPRRKSRNRGGMNPEALEGLSFSELRALVIEQGKFKIGMSGEDMKKVLIRG